jgi:foldase protein PrsA
LWITAAAVLTCTAVLAQEPEQPEEQPAEVLATVDGEEITSDDLWWYIEQTRGGDILDDFILRTLIAAEAEEHQVKVGTPEVDDALAELRARYDSDAEFERWLHETGQTLKGLRMKLQRDIVVEKLLEKRMGLTDAGVRRYYDSHPEEFTKPPRVHLWDIVTLNLDDAFAARERLAAGEDFAAVDGQPHVVERAGRAVLTEADLIGNNRHGYLSP